MFFAFYSFGLAALALIVQPRGSTKAFFAKPKYYIQTCKIGLKALPVAYGGISIQIAYWLYFGFEKKQF
jgi:hypothetical protein